MRTSKAMISLDKIEWFHWLFGGLMVFWAGLFVWFAGISLVEISAAFLLTVTYFIWGVVYHLKHKTLHLKNVIEYFLMAFIGFILLAFIVS
ncbi:MAG: hypothetical protein GXP43_02650 [bacterium]|nr:hypothetical protein [bacterium]